MGEIRNVKDALFLSVGRDVNTRVHVEFDKSLFGETGGFPKVFYRRYSRNGCARRLGPFDL